MIELNDVTFAWPEEIPILNKLTFAVKPEEKIVVLGANGCGKSTLLKLLNGLIEPTEGSIYWQGDRLTRQYLKGHSRYFRQNCVLLFQHPEAMLFNPTVREELSYGPRQLGLTDIDTRIAYWSEQLQLTALLDKAPFLLSGGQKQKVALACLLMLDPSLLLLDEPSASLDPATVGWLIDTLAHSKKTLIIATHNLSLAAELGERCIVLGANGAILFDGLIQSALADLPLLEQAGLAHRHLHYHGGAGHKHIHIHDWQ